MNTSIATEGRVEIDGRIFNPYSKDFIRSPWATWEKMVLEYPVAWHKDLNMWVVSSHDACAEMLKNNLFTPNYKAWEHAPPEKPEAEKNDFERSLDHGLFATRTQDHLRLRKLAMPAFSKPVMGKIDAKIRDLVTGVFDEIGQPGQFDAFSMIAEKLPVRAIARMVGVLGRWGHDSELPIVLDIVRGIWRHAENNRGGLSFFLNVRAYCAVLIFTAYGLGLTRAERWKILHQFLTAEIPVEYQEHLNWTVERLFLWGWKGGKPDLWNEIIGGPDRYYTPLSDYLLKLFNEWGTSFAGLADFELLFDRFELLASLAHLERREAADIQAELKAGRGWVTITPETGEARFQSLWTGAVD